MLGISDVALALEVNLYAWALLNERDRERNGEGEM
jgi:hypothetical protein